jgi:hypothetical protein
VKFRVACPNVAFVVRDKKHHKMAALESVGFIFRLQNVSGTLTYHCGEMIERDFSTIDELMEFLRTADASARLYGNGSDVLELEI